MTPTPEQIARLEMLRENCAKSADPDYRTLGQALTALLASWRDLRETQGCDMCQKKIAAQGDELFSLRRQLEEERAAHVSLRLKAEHATIDRCESLEAQLAERDKALEDAQWTLRDLREDFDRTLKSNELYGKELAERDKEVERLRAESDDLSEQLREALGDDPYTPERSREVTILQAGSRAFREEQEGGER